MPDREARPPEPVLSEDWQLLLVGVWEDVEGGGIPCRAEPGSGMGRHASAPLDACASTAGRCWANALPRLSSPVETSLHNRTIDQRIET